MSGALYITRKGFLERTFVELVPQVRLQPRMYTCASSALAEPESLRLCITVHESFPRHGRMHKGVCTNWLKSGAQNTGKKQPDGTYRQPPRRFKASATQSLGHTPKGRKF